MAHPGYPQMGQMPMGGPVGPATMQRPIRRGTSKAVPVVVSAGLAVGVFCGLLFGVGTGKTEASAATAPKDDKAEVKKDVAVATPDPAKTPEAPKTGSTAVATTAVTPPPTTSKPPPVEVPKTAKLTVHIKPEAAASAAKIMVDGKEVSGTTVDIPVDAGGKKSVKVAITAPGYHSIDQKVDIEGDETKLDLEMTKRSGGSTAAVPANAGTSGRTTGASGPAKGPTGPAKGPTGGKKTGGKKTGGIIDI
jgi:hypothetical protein